MPYDHKERLATVFDQCMIEVCAWEVKLTQGQTGHLFSNVIAVKAFSGKRKDSHVVTNVTIGGKQRTITADMVTSAGAERLSVEKK